MRRPPFEMVGAAAGTGTPPDFTKPHLGLASAVWLGTGLLLIKAAVFTRLKPPWFFESYDLPPTDDNPEGMMGEDLNFIRCAIAAGFKPTVDLDLTFEVGHVGEHVFKVPRPAAKN